MSDGNEHVNHDREYEAELRGRTLAESIRGSDPESRTSTEFEKVRSCLITIKSSMLAIEDFEPIEESENNARCWQTICDNVAKIRAYLGGNLLIHISPEFGRVIRAGDARKLLTLLDDIDEIYHPDDPTGPVGPPMRDIITRLDNLIWSHIETP